MTAAVLTYLALAAKVWGPAPCGQPVVQFDKVIPGNLTGYVLSRDGKPVDCTIHILSTYRQRAFRTQLCTIIIHEDGHITGRKHSSDPRNVMYEDPRPYWRCKSLIRKRNLTK